MAYKKNKSPQKESQAASQKPKNKKPLRRKIVFLFLLLLILGSGIITAFYFSGLFNIKEFADKRIKSIPVVGQLFEKEEKDLSSEKILAQKEAALKKQREKLEEEKTELEAEKIAWEMEKQSSASDKEEVTQNSQSDSEPSAYEANYKRLARLYGEMKPQEAAKIISQLDDELMVQIFSFMKPETLAPILGLMDSAQAARITKKMSVEP